MEKQVIRPNECKAASPYWNIKSGGVFYYFSPMYWFSVEFQFENGTRQLCWHSSVLLVVMFWKWSVRHNLQGLSMHIGKESFLRSTRYVNVIVISKGPFWKSIQSPDVMVIDFSGKGSWGRGRERGNASLHFLARSIEKQVPKETCSQAPEQLSTL